MSADAPPKAFGSYRVLHRLGEGGNGLVYLAEDALLKRQVAIKVPRLDKQANPEVIERFLREAQAAARIQHPNVCPVLHVGEQDGGYFLVMPYLEGTPLDQLVVPGQPWEPARALDLMLKLAGGVQAIHDVGLIHRDLKPGNAMMLGDEPVLLDLGLARSVVGEDQRLTRTGQILGTPAYMAPEQVKGALNLLGPPTDVWALGVILYQLLTGELPFRDHRVELVCAQILHAVPPAPSELCPGLGPWAETVCGKAMVKEPGQRYGSVAELAEVLRSCRKALGARTSRDVSGERRTAPPPLPPSAGDTQTPQGVTLDPAGVRPGARGAVRPDRARRRSRRQGAWLAVLVGVPVLTALLAVLVWVLVSVDLTTTGSSGDPGGDQVAGNGVPVEPAPGARIPQPRPPDPNPPQGGPEPPPPDPMPPQVGPNPRQPEAGEDPPPNPNPPPKPAREIANSIGMKLVLVPAGKFTMGSPEGEADRYKDETQHEVEITKPFYLGIHEVTQAEYEKVMGTNPSRFNKDNGGGPDHPVEEVSWDDAVEFCKKLSEMEKEKSSGRVYRLPTEAEWEYSCREGGSSKTPFYFGTTLTSDLANFDGRYPYGTNRQGDHLERTTEVGSYKPNALGLFDMHGNVWEWCADWYDEKYYSASRRKDPTGPTTGTSRVLRGGGWCSYGHNCRAANRYRSDPGNRNYNFGFRVVCIPPGTP